jgi:hypothetical protein
MGPGLPMIKQGFRGRGARQRCNRRLRLQDFPDHFGFFLPLAGITHVRQIAENSFDIRATSRLNRPYVTLKELFTGHAHGPHWGGSLI